MLNAFLMFMVKQQLIFDLRTFVANSTLSRLRAFGGALLAKIWWEGARKHFIRPGSTVSTVLNLSIDLNCPKLNINVIFSIYTASKMFGTVSQYCAATSILDGIILF